MVAAATLILLAGSALLDRPVAQWVHDRHPVEILQRPLVSYRKWSEKRQTYRQSQIDALSIIKAPGNFLFTLAVAATLAIRHRRRLMAAALLLASGAVGGLLYSLLKWVVGRTRPFKGAEPFQLHPFPDGLRGLFGAENLSFPSGHTCLAFATAAMLGMLLPRWRWVFYAGAALVAVERVMEGAHYPSDAVGGAIVGILAARLIWRVGASIGTGAPMRYAVDQPANETRPAQ